MPSKRYKKLPEKTKDLNAEVIEKLLPEVKKNCTTKFDEDKKRKKKFFWKFF